MKFNEDILERYLTSAPVPLAFERILEARIYERHSFRRPILDLGCGEGLFAKMVFGEKIDTGIDPDLQEIELAKKNGSYHELIACKGDQIDKPDGYYQTAFSNSVLEHIPDIAPVFREVYRLLARGGKFYITVPSHHFDEYSIVYQTLSVVGLRFFADRYRKFFNRFWRHYHFYPPEGWIALAQRFGFTVTEIHTYGTKRICMLNDFLVPFSFGSFVMKKLTHHWVCFPALRRLLMIPVAMFGRWALEEDYTDQKGGLVFLEMTKV